MRTLEQFLVYGEVLAIAWPAIFGVRTRRGIVAGLLVALFVLHWQLEGLRWQMIPIYGAALGLTIGDLLIYERSLDWTRRVARGVFGLTGLAVAMVLPIVLPVPDLPLPTGPSSVGTFTTEIVDIDRDELYGSVPGSPRRFNVQVWYPADVPDGSEPGPWANDWAEVGPEVASVIGFPAWFLNHARYAESHTYPGADPVDGSFPVVIYSHGWTGFRSNAVNQIENLVSNGYVVIAPDHTYGAVATVFEDGEVVTYDANALPDPEEVTEDAYAIAADQLVAVFAADLSAILDELEEGAGGRFAEVASIVDTTRVGLFGHSAGGGAAIRTCLEDERCDAVLGLDPWVEPLPDETLAITPMRPAMYMRSEEWIGTENDALLRGLAGRSEAVSYWIGIEGAWHNDFNLMTLISPYAARFGLKGPIPAGRVIPIVDRYLVGFFDTFLLGTGSAAIDATGFEEVALEIIRPDPS